MNRPRFIPGLAYGLDQGSSHSALITTSEECEECGGEGWVTVNVPGGYYSTAQEQWYPDEREEDCEACNGTGVTEEHRCAHCGELEDDCNCDEDDLFEWEGRMHDLVNRAIANAEFGASEERVTWNEAHYIAALRETPIDYIDGQAMVKVYGTLFRGIKEE